ncbi:MAG: hypothetical protein AAFU56_09805, partial [Pseudomonadota bacterium]
MAKSDQNGAGNKKPNPRLRAEDDEIWTRVAKTTEPLRRPANRFPHHGVLKDEMADLMRATVSPNWPPKPVKTKTVPPFVQAKPMLKTQNHHPIEDRVHKHLAKGRLSIDGRIDLGPLGHRLRVAAVV